MRRKGLLVVVDGPSASGKDSIIKQVLKDLDGLGIKALSIEETKEKNYDRKKILEAKQYGGQKVAEIIIDERRKLYKATVSPQLISGTLVIANRGEPTTLSYQTLGNEINMEKIWDMHRRQNIPSPDLVVIANCSVGEALRRESLKKFSGGNKNENSMSGKFTSARKQIHANYKKVKGFLEDKGLFVIQFNTAEMKLSEESRRIVDFIKNKINYINE